MVSRARVVSAIHPVSRTLVGIVQQDYAQSLAAPALQYLDEGRVGYSPASSQWFYLDISWTGFRVAKMKLSFNLTLELVRTILFTPLRRALRSSQADSSALATRVPPPRTVCRGPAPTRTHPLPTTL
jgi:hypothetical protein